MTTEEIKTAIETKQMAKIFTRGDLSDYDILVKYPHVGDMLVWLDRDIKELQRQLENKING